MTQFIPVKPLTQAAFAAFGDVIACRGTPTVMINQGNCARHTDLAAIDITGDGGRTGISLFQGQPYAMPLALAMMERHPLGSQAFIPMSPDPFLVIVAPDEQGRPGTPQAFVTAAGEGVNYHRNVWHGVLTPLGAPRLFAVVDRIGTGDNLEEFWFETPYQIGFAEGSS